MEIFSFISEQLNYLKSRTKCIADAEDIIQDVYVKVWIRKDYFESKPIDEQRKIIRLCIRNLFYDSIEHKNRVKRKRCEYFLPKYSRPEAISAIMLKEVVEVLNENEFGEYALECANGFTTREIMERHHVKQSLALKRIYIARQFLRKKYLALN